MLRGRRQAAHRRESGGREEPGRGGGDGDAAERDEDEDESQPLEIVGDVADVAGDHDRAARRQRGRAGGDR